MLNDADVTEVINWQYEKMALKAIQGLEKNNIHAEYAVDRVEALSKLIKAIPSDATIGIGDSVTLHQIRFYEWLNEQRDRTIYNPFSRNPETGKLIYTPSEHFAMLQKALISDVYLTSTNALTLDGKLVSLDGRGNRVAAMLFGPKKVILVTGANKIVRDLDEAMVRMETAAPLNGRRHQI
ncbi:MAG TPA: lactate utilization protein, partial [Syntrophorhabdaceae bacterium]|nr:lactate utilization protein [Syntrophorhabdaceae bacterium]